MRLGRHGEGKGDQLRARRGGVDGGGVDQAHAGATLAVGAGREVPMVTLAPSRARSTAPGVPPRSAQALAARSAWASSQVSEWSGSWWKSRVRPAPARAA